MGTPQTLDDFDLPVAVPGVVQTFDLLPDLLIIRVEGTAEQLPKRLARTLQLYGFEVRIGEEAASDTSMGQDDRMG